MPEIDWDKAETALISLYKWDKSYMPHAAAKLICTDNSLHVRIICEEENPKAVYHNFFDPVYCDSCLEFFFSHKKDYKYINCEMNSLGASLIAVGYGRNDRVRIDKLITPPLVKASREGENWCVEVTFTLDMLKILLGDDVSFDTGSVWYGNFYKCGDKTEIPHYGMWSEVGTENPDFHRPEYFGELIII